jgi:glycosyltransferase involved in cell wall biosynthesis
VDTRRFAPAAPDERRALRERLGFPVDAVLAVFVGRLSKEKGVMELLRAWADARPAASLAVVGPPMTDHPWDVSAEARTLVEREGLADSVQFLGGQPPDVVAAWLRIADFAVQPSHFEAMGLAAAEAMAAGVPVIASDIGGYRDFVVDGENGLLVPPHDVAALAGALTRMAADASLRVRLGAAARTAALQFDEQIVLERFAELLG